MVHFTLCSVDTVCFISCMVSVFSRKRYQGSRCSFGVQQWLCLPNQHNLACFAVGKSVRDRVQTGSLAGLV